MRTLRSRGVKKPLAPPIASIPEDSGDEEEDDPGADEDEHPEPPTFSQLNMDDADPPLHLDEDDILALVKDSGSPTQKNASLANDSAPNNPLVTPVTSTNTADISLASLEAAAAANTPLGPPENLLLPGTAHSIPLPLAAFPDFAPLVTLALTQPFCIGFSAPPPCVALPPLALAALAFARPCVTLALAQPSSARTRLTVHVLLLTLRRMTPLPRALALARAAATTRLTAHVLLITLQRMTHLPRALALAPAAARTRPTHRARVPAAARIRLAAHALLLALQRTTHLARTLALAAARTRPAHRARARVPAAARICLANRALLLTLHWTSRFACALALAAARTRLTRRARVPAKARTRLAARALLLALQQMTHLARALALAVARTRPAFRARARVPAAARTCIAAHALLLTLPRTSHFACVLALAAARTRLTRRARVPADARTRLAARALLLTLRRMSHLARVLALAEARTHPAHCARVPAAAQTRLAARTHRARARALALAAARTHPASRARAPQPLHLRAGLSRAWRATAIETATRWRHSSRQPSSGKRRVVKDAKAKLKKMAQEHRLEMEEKCKRVAAELNLPLKDVEAEIRGSSKMKKSRTESMFNALVWNKGIELNSGKGQGERLLLPALQRLVKEEEESSPKSKADKEEILAAFKTMKENKQKGTRMSNREAAKDVTWVIDEVYNELVNLEARTGARAILIVAGSHVSDTIPSTALGTDKSLNFINTVLKLSPTQLATKFQAYSCLVEGDNADDEKTHSERRAKCVSMIHDGLKQITNKKNIKMEYVNYDEKIRHGEGVELTGLPPGYVLVAPSKGTPAEHIRKLLDRLKANTCRWTPVSAAEKQGLMETYANAAKKPRKVRSDKKQKETEGSDEEEVGTGKKQKMAKKGGESKAAGRKRKRAAEGEDNDNEDTAPVVPHRKSSPKKTSSNDPKPTPSSQKSKSAKAGSKRKSRAMDDSDSEEHPKKKRKGVALKPSKEEATLAAKAMNAALKKLIENRERAKVRRLAGDEGV
ncbi:hypothetical protein DFH09DRAFT_1399441 [Mycena vulgaris]|nr:hypothetical protein DFH09DRAFT_1399441 [Mycena vulgaris]